MHHSIDTSALNRGIVANLLQQRGPTLAETTRERMIEAAEKLLAERGLSGASFPEVLALTGAPRGSVYHYFPEGKGQLVAEALDFAAERMFGWLEARRGNAATEIVAYYFHVWAEMLRRSDFAAGCSATAVLTASQEPDLVRHAAEAFASQRRQLTELLIEGHLDGDSAPGFAALLVASAEGAVLLSRGSQSLDPLDSVRDQLIARAAELSH